MTPPSGCISKPAMFLLLLVLTSCESKPIGAPSPAAEPLLYLEELPTEPSDDPPLFFFLHGRDSNERDSLHVTKRIAAQFLIVSVRAPVERGPDRYAWYTSRDLLHEGEKQIAANRILASIDELLAIMGRPRDERVTLGGFSQGGAMSLYTAAAAPRRFRGVVSFSPARFSIPNSPAVPLFIAHGTRDRVVPLEDVEPQIDRLLKGPNVSPHSTFVTFEGGHAIPSTVIDQAATWIESLP